MPNYKYKFGDTLNPGSDETARIGFIGQELDIEHGYFNMGARYYDPELGRFLSVDPLFEIYTEYSPYNYCNNSPMIFGDPSGMYLESTYFIGKFHGLYLFQTREVTVTARRTPLDKNHEDNTRLGGKGGVNYMGYDPIISDIWNITSPLYQILEENLAENGEMNGNPRGFGHLGSGYGNSTGSSGGGNSNSNPPPNNPLHPYYRAEEGDVNTSGFLDNLNYVATEFVKQAPVLSYCHDASQNIYDGEYLQAGINFLNGVGDAILFFGTLGTATLATTTGKQLFKQGVRIGIKATISKTFTYSKHALKQMEVNRINEKWIKTIIKNGEELVDIRNGNTIHLLRNGSAKGHHVAVVVNSTTNNHIITVLKGRRIINKQWIPK